MRVLEVRYSCYYYTLAIIMIGQYAPNFLPRLNPGGGGGTPGGKPPGRGGGGGIPPGGGGGGGGGGTP